jgi:hypothetical protein
MPELQRGALLSAIQDYSESRRKWRDDPESPEVAALDVGLVVE